MHVAPRRFSSTFIHCLISIVTPGTVWVNIIKKKLLVSQVSSLRSADPCSLLRVGAGSMLRSWTWVCHPPHRALDTGQFRFWSKFKVSFCVQKWPIQIIWDILSNIWWTKLGFFGSKCEKSGSQKQEKWENGQKQPILGIFWCFWVTKSASPRLKSCIFYHFCGLWWLGSWKVPQ